MSLKNQGVELWRRLIEQNIHQVHYLGNLIQNDNEFELLAPVPLNVICFRYFAPEYSEQRLNAINQEIMLRLQESGIAIISNTILNGKFALRIANTNHRSRYQDFELTIQTIRNIGRELTRNIS